MKLPRLSFLILFVVACIFGGLYIQSESRVKILAQEMGPTYWKNKKLEELFAMGIEAHQNLMRIVNGAATSDDAKAYLYEHMPAHIENVDSEYVRLVGKYASTPAPHLNARDPYGEARKAAQDQPE